MNQPIRQARFDLVSRELEPEQQLAAAVLWQAVHDLDDPTLPALERDRARLFLERSLWFEFWCRVARLNPEFVRERALVE